MHVKYSKSGCVIDSLQKIPEHTIMLFVFYPKILQKHCSLIVLRSVSVFNRAILLPRETENNAYAKCLGDKQRALWYVLVLSGVVK